MHSRFIKYIAHRMRAFQKRSKSSPRLFCEMNTCKLQQVTSLRLLSAPKWLMLLINHAIKAISQHSRTNFSGTLDILPLNKIVSIDRLSFDASNMHYARFAMFHRKFYSCIENRKLYYSCIK